MNHFARSIKTVRQFVLWTGCAWLLSAPAARVHGWQDPPAADSPGPKRLFNVQRVAVGRVAPEIEGEDIEGQSFKLSDYRGKVVVLDFWGDW